MLPLTKRDSVTPFRINPMSSIHCHAHPRHRNRRRDAGNHPSLAATSAAMAMIFGVTSKTTKIPFVILDVPYLKSA